MTTGWRWTVAIWAFGVTLAASHVAIAQMACDPWRHSTAGLSWHWITLVRSEVIKIGNLGTGDVQGILVAVDERFNSWTVTPLHELSHRSSETRGADRSSRHRSCDRSSTLLIRSSKTCSAVRRNPIQVGLVCFWSRATFFCMTLLRNR